MNAPLPVPPTWTTATTEAVKTGTWRASLPHYVHAPSPCRQACPVNGDIAEWIGLARTGDLRGAWEVLTRHNPFPAVAGRVCHHPCEAACNRGAYDEALAICALERAVGDAALERGWTHAPADVERDGHVAVVGGGPSGLSAAYQLRRRGWRVTLYEARNELGGLMRHGIPSYRLARDVLDAEIARIVALGVQVRCGSELGSASDFERLHATHDAVYLALGAGTPKRLAQLPAGAAWWMDGAEYLARANAGTPPRLGHRLVVVGGGSAALDVARSARRAGHAVTILALEGAGQMPAQREEVSEALEEGIALVDGAMLATVAPDGADLALACVRVRFQPEAERGAFTVTPLAGSEFELRADAVVTAIGQDPDFTVLAPWLGAQGKLLVVDRQHATAVDRVWAGGDLTSMARFVTEAIGMGKRAALAIDRSLRGEPAAPAQADEAAVGLAQIATFYHPHAPRVVRERRPVAERLAESAEVQLGIDAAQMLAEAQRCFSCGTCIQCDNCFHYCPDLAVRRVEGGYEVLTDYCKGCGVCVRECPTGSMTMREEVR
jgi:NADPH-dependent glutamate synthase beta subunit-like oxidoreductase